MSDADGDAVNVIDLESRRYATRQLVAGDEEPELGCTLHLVPDGGMEMVLRARDGDVVAVLEYRLAARSPENFDLDVLRAAWDVWRNTSTCAS